MKLYVYKNHAGVRTWHAHLEDVLESAQGDLCLIGHPLITIQRARISPVALTSEEDLAATLNWLGGLDTSSAGSVLVTFELVATVDGFGIRLADKGETLA